MITQYQGCGLDKLSNEHIVCRIKSIHSEGKCQTPENEEQLKKQMP